MAEWLPTIDGNHFRLEDCVAISTQTPEPASGEIRVFAYARGDGPGGCCLAYSRDFGEINSAALPLHRFGDMLEAE